MFFKKFGPYLYIVLAGLFGCQRESFEPVNNISYVGVQNVSDSRVYPTIVNAADGWDMYFGVVVPDSSAEKGGGGGFNLPRLVSLRWEEGHDRVPHVIEALLPIANLTQAEIVGVIFVYTGKKEWFIKGMGRDNRVIFYEQLTENRVTH